MSVSTAVLSNRLTAVHGLVDDAPAESSAEETAYAAPHEFVVVHNQNTKSLPASTHLRVSSHALWCPFCRIQ